MRTTGLIPAVLPALLLSCPLSGQCAVVADIYPGTTGSRPSFMATAFDQELYLVAQHPTQAGEVWKWDAASGLNMLADINPNGGANSNGFEACCTLLGPRVFFDAYKPGYGSELWMTDGTAAGTTMVKNIRPGSSGSSPWNIAALDNRVLFAANDGTHGVELWVSDGTAAGTTFVKDIMPGSLSSRPGEMVQVGDRLVFTAYEANIGRQLWSSDGTTAGTVLLRDFGSNVSGALVPVAVGDFVYFGADDSTLGSGLWKSDGTPAGTTFVSPMAPGDMCACDGTLFFTAGRNSPTGQELWKSDGTLTGTVLVKDIIPGAASSSPAALTCAGDRLFFRGADRAHGAELWVSDGTTNGTQLVSDIEPNGSSSPAEIVPVGDGVCFRANVASDSELWFSDGTQTGTFRVCDLDPNASSNPTQLMTCAGRLFFTATTPGVGHELMWVQTPGAVQTVLGTGSRPDRPTLTVRGGAPVIGTTIDLVADGPSGHVGFLIFGPARKPTPPIPALMHGGCDWVSAFTPLSTVIMASANPDFSLALPIPNHPPLEGVALHFQAGWADLTATPVLQMSNGLAVVLGPTAPH